MWGELVCRGCQEWTGKIIDRTGRICSPDEHFDFTKTEAERMERIMSQLNEHVTRQM